MRHNICLILFNLLVLSTVSGQLFEDGYQSFFERNIPPCQVMISKTYIGDDSLPIKTDTIRFDSTGNRIAVTNYINNEFSFSRRFTYNLYGDVIAEYYINDQRDTMVNFYSCSYKNETLIKKVSSSGITNITYNYNSRNNPDLVVSSNSISEQNFIFGFPKTFEFEVYENYLQVYIYKRKKLISTIKTELKYPQIIIYREQYKYQFGKITTCIETNYNGDENSITIKYQDNKPVQLSSGTFLVNATYYKNGALQAVYTIDPNSLKVIDTTYFTYIY